MAIAEPGIAIRLLSRLRLWMGEDVGLSPRHLHDEHLNSLEDTMPSLWEAEQRSMEQRAGMLSRLEMAPV